ncbi:MAG: SPASM domain-containing protein [Clostridia bacterium]|nr:SPASM domain-containing protein [Clostridia bacterium]
MYTRVYVEITNICNMKCSFCHGHCRQAKMMSKLDFQRVLDELKGKTKHIYYHLMGEPLTHPELNEFLVMAKEQGFQSMITTNGTLLNKCGDALLQSGIYKINISLHSFEKQDRQAFESYLTDIVEFVKKASSSRTIVVLRLWNKGADDSQNSQIISFLRPLLDGEWTENERGIRIRNKLHIEWGDRFEWPDKDGKYQGEQVFCYGMRDHFGILADGTVVPCCLDSDGVINLGNVFTENLSDILNSERAKAIKHGFGSYKATEDLCKRCPYARRFAR